MSSAYQFRMAGGFPGAINRSHPVSVVPEPIDSVTPPTLYGQPVLINQAADAGQYMVRPFVTGDSAQQPWGFTVRPFPIQASSTTNNGAATIGGATPPATGVIDIMRSGYMTVNLPAGGSPQKGQQVYVRVAASATIHVMGAVEAASDGGNTVALTGAVFNGSADANGNVEIAFNI
jgi:hypothetical protein